MLKQTNIGGERIGGVERPGVAVRAAYWVGRRLFGRVPTPQRIMSHRPALMLGLGGLWSAIEFGGTIDARLRALLQLHVAKIRDVAY